MTTHLLCPDLSYASTTEHDVVRTVHNDGFEDVLLVSTDADWEACKRSDADYVILTQVLAEQVSCDAYGPDEWLFTPLMHGPVMEQVTAAFAAE